MAEPSERQVFNAMRDMHSNVDGLQGLDAPDSKPLINSVDVAEPIFRDFLSTMLRRLDEIGAPDYSADQHQAWVLSECARINHLFTSYPDFDPDDYTLTMWNTPEQVGHHVRLASGIEGEDRTAIRDVLAQGVVDVLTVLEAHDEEPVESWGWKLDALIDSMTRMVVGVDGLDDAGGLQ